MLCRDRVSLETAFITLSPDGREAVRGEAGKELRAGRADDAVRRVEVAPR